MADAEAVVAGTEPTASMMEQLGKSFTELESLRDTSDDKVQWKEIEEYFHNLERLLKKKSEELEEKEKAFEEKESETRTLLTERETAVTAKEQASLDHVQKIKDAAVSVIAEAREKYTPASPEPIDDVGSTENKVSSSLGGDTNSPVPGSEEKSPHRSGERVEGVAIEVKTRPKLTQLCEQMDAKGLRNFIIENKKNIAAIREELPIALKSVTEPARLVLDSLEGFYPSDQVPDQGNKIDTAALQGIRRSCVLLMEIVGPLLAGADMGDDDDHHPLSPETKQQAKAIADEWKPKLGGVDSDAANGNSLEAGAFLQLLATFRIASEFDDEELCKLLLVISRRRQAPELCRDLGLTHKVPGLVEELVKSGKQIDAVNFVHAFQLTESFPLVPLLKAHLEDFRSNSQEKGANSEGVAGAQNDSNSQELMALRAVIRCIIEYKLEAEYPLDPLQARVSQLESAKAEKRRMRDVPKHQKSKRPRPNTGFYGSQPRTNMPRGTYNYMGVQERYPQVPIQGAYGQQTIIQRPYNGAPSNYGGYVGNGFQPSHQSYMQ